MVSLAFHHESYRRFAHKGVLGKVAPESNVFLRNCEDFPVLEYVKDPESVEKLWKLSEKLVGETFDI